MLRPVPSERNEDWFGVKPGYTTSPLFVAVRGIEPLTQRLLAPTPNSILAEVGLEPTTRRL